MLYAGLDLSRQRLDVCLLDEEGRTIEVTAATPEVFGLRELVARISRHGDEVTGVIESTTLRRGVRKRDIQACRCGMSTSTQPRSCPPLSE